MVNIMESASEVKFVPKSENEESISAPVVPVEKIKFAVGYQRMIKAAAANKNGELLNLLTNYKIKMESLIYPQQEPRPQLLSKGSFSDLFDIKPISLINFETSEQPEKPPTTLSRGFSATNLNDKSSPKPAFFRRDSSGRFLSGFLQSKNSNVKETKISIQPLGSVSAIPTMKKVQKVIYVLEYLAQIELAAKRFGLEFVLDVKQELAQIHQYIKDNFEAKEIDEINQVIKDAKAKLETLENKKTDNNSPKKKMEKDSKKKKLSKEELAEKQVTDQLKVEIKSLQLFNTMFIDSSDKTIYTPELLKYLAHTLHALTPDVYNVIEAKAAQSSPQEIRAKLIKQIAPKKKRFTLSSKKPTTLDKKLNVLHRVISTSNSILTDIAKFDSLEKEILLAINVLKDPNVDELEEKQKKAIYSLIASNFIAMQDILQRSPDLQAALKVENKKYEIARDIISKQESFSDSKLNPDLNPNYKKDEFDLINKTFGEKYNVELIKGNNANIYKISTKEENPVSILIRAVYLKKENETESASHTRENQTLTFSKDVTKLF